METTILNLVGNEPNWQRSFLDFCDEICNSKREEWEDDSQIRKGDTICCYCGRRMEEPEAVQAETSELVCADCRRRMVTDMYQGQKLVNEVEKNIRRLFSIRLEQEIIVEKKKSTRKQISKLFAKNDKESKETQEIFIQNTKKGYYQLIMKELPDVVIMAEVAYFLCLEFFCIKYGRKNADFLIGLAGWLEIHYLYVLDLADYAAIYDKKIKTDIMRGNGYNLWSEKLGSPLNRQIVWMDKIYDNINVVKDEMEQEMQGSENMETAEEQTGIPDVEYNQEDDK